VCSRLIDVRHNKLTVMRKVGVAARVPQVRDRKTNIGKGIAFIEFKTKAAAAAAMRLSEPKLNGRPLRISFLKQPKAGASAAAAATAATDLKPGKFTAPLGRLWSWCSCFSSFCTLLPCVAIPHVCRNEL